LSRSEKEKMLANEPYLASDPQLVRERERARRLCALYNATAPDQRPRRDELLWELLAYAGEGVWVEPPFHCDYGSNIRLGDGVYVNCGCVFLDCNTVQVGDGVKFGPAVQVYTAYHPVDPRLRRTGVEMAAPVRIGHNVWVGGGAILCPGVEVGDDTTIGAGSVVTRSLPAGVLAVGSPCRVVRRLT
jgi:maltose O-acetyltransferase